MLDRIRNDGQWAIITLFAVLVVVAIVPFAVFRFLQGQYLITAIDALIIFGVTFVYAHSWRVGKADRAGLFMATLTSVSCIAVSLLYGRHGLLWSYAVLTTNFLLTRRRYALLLNAGVLILVGWRGGVFDSGIERVVFLVTGTLVSICAYIFAHQAVRQRQQLEALALHDPLTDAHNRRVMENDLALAWETHRNNPEAVAVAILDLDYFKRVNDSYGHKAGDHVLVDLVRIIRGHSRLRDRLYRFGGEEFVLLLPDTDTRGMRAALEKLRQRIGANLACPDGRKVSVSIGAAMLHHDPDWPSWLARADAALYRAKNTGRNKLVVDGDPLLPGETVQAFERRHGLQTG